MDIKETKEWLLWLPLRALTYFAGDDQWVDEYMDGVINVEMRQLLRLLHQCDDLNLLVNDPSLLEWIERERISIAQMIEMLGGYTHGHYGEVYGMYRQCSWNQNCEYRHAHDQISDYLEFAKRLTL